MGADASFYHESLHFLSECHWYELIPQQGLGHASGHDGVASADCPDRVEPGVN